jgi:sialate O-acetylesterase
MKNKINILKALKILMPVLFIFPGFINADDWQRLMKLKGQWKFSIGDNLEWAEVDYDDYDWEEVWVPSYWENEGFNGYNGYAWYRKTFELDEELDFNNIYLFLGYIDDVDEVYLNGRNVGSSGGFPPDFATAYNAERKYPIPVKYFNQKGKNVLAVRVFDATMGGGINSGEIGLYVRKNSYLLGHDFEGKWQFNTGDKDEWKELSYDDGDWDSIFVPGYWEHQGYKDYNGVAWYRKTFTINKRYDSQKLVLILGKIDDIDEAYLNGVKIGFTGVIEDDPEESSFEHEWQEFRGYLFDSKLLNVGKNVIAVRVYDNYINGGIYQGPIGITTQSKYRKMEKE